MDSVPKLLCPTYNTLRADPKVKRHLRSQAECQLAQLNANLQSSALWGLHVPA